MSHDFDFAIIGSHGYRAKYGGWDQLVNKLVDIGSINNKTNFLIYNSKLTVSSNPPVGSKCINFSLHAHGFQGLFFDFISIFHAIFFTRTLILLGAQGLPVALFIKIFLPSLRIIVNPGGVEWERPKFGFFSKVYLKFVFILGYIFSNIFVLDNAYYLNYVSNRYKNSNKIKIIPYGGEIFQNNNLEEVFRLYDFPVGKYYLSVSRALADNQLFELVDFFSKNLNFGNLVLISNFKSSEYGLMVYERFSSFPNIFLLDSVYDKNILDIIRNNCFCYIHTHSLCGSAPSLIEMVVARKPVISFDVPQNRYTLDNQCLYFTRFEELLNFSCGKILQSIPSEDLASFYSWDRCVYEYLSLKNCS
jgi:hypothetical protein